MFQLSKLSTIVVLGIVAIACGGSSSPTAPTPSFPQVAGNYAGQVTITLPEVAQSQACPASTSVTQAGSTVNIAPIIFSGACGSFSIPMGQATIDNTGAITGSTGGTFTDATCGGVYTYTGSGGFFGREFRLSLNGTSRTCLNFNFTAVLSR